MLIADLILVDFTVCAWRVVAYATTTQTHTERSCSRSRKEVMVCAKVVFITVTILY